MKIRIKSNSLRYRLTRPDVKQLVETGTLDEKLGFGGHTLHYGIKLTDDLHLSATYRDDYITLFMPKAMAQELMETERVGFENNDQPLHLLVEKDFTCLDNVAEDQSDNYPNPLAVNIHE